ncbi:MAG: hypothetical protein V2A56_07295 [bacterium]
MSPDSPQNKEQILGELLSITEKAVRAARIDHRPELQSLLNRRERLLAMLWNFDPDLPLPSFEEGNIGNVQPSLTNREKSLLKKVTSLDNKLLTHMHSSRERLLVEQNDLRRGERVISGLRHLARDGKTGGKRVDIRG